MRTKTVFLFRCKIIKLFFAFLLCYGGAGYSTAQAQQSATATGTASASVIRPLTTHHLRTLRFGQLRPGSNGGTVRINPKTNQRFFSGTVRPIVKPCKGYGRARFRVTGEQNQQYEIFLPKEINVRRFRRRHHDPVLKARNFKAYSKNKGEIGNLGLLGARGKDRFYVGGELFMPPNALPGYYATRIDVIVAYQ